MTLPVTWDPKTDGQLWMWILANGGIRRSRDYWSKHLTTAENRAAYRYLDRADDDAGTPLDLLAEEIADLFPHYGIRTDDDLWGWLQASR